MADNHKEKLKMIIEKLTQKTKSVFSEKIFLEAGEFGIGEMHVKRMIDELLEEDYLMQPVRGVFKRKI